MLPALCIGRASKGLISLTAQTNDVPMLEWVTRVGLATALLVVVAYAYRFGDHSRWRSALTGRFIYGVPWGTVVTVGIVVCFYVFAQTGLENPSEPVTVPFVSWSYLYPTGVLAAPIAHGSVQHIASNVAATILLGPVVEYAWGHYPPRRRRDGTASGRGVTDGGTKPAGTARRVLARPWIRAVVVFPATILLVGFLTAAFSIGPGLGFSGAVFALVGFAVIRYPLTAVVAVVATGALVTVFDAFVEPVVRAGIETQPPAPPAWAGIGFYAHMLGFLIGVVAAIVLLRRSGHTPPTERVLLATFLVGLVQSLWLIVGGGFEEFVLYRGAGVSLVAVLTVVATLGATGSTRGLPRPLSVLPRAPTRRQLATVWVIVISLGTTLSVAVAVRGAETVWLAATASVLAGAVLVLPAVAPLAPDRLITSPVSRRTAALATIVVGAVVMMLVGIPSGLVTVSDTQPSASESVDIAEYTVAYQEHATPAQETLLPTGADRAERDGITGVTLVSERREIWTVAVREERLAHDGNATVHVGGVGWREPIDVDRTGWELTGNGTVYAVDLTVDGETTRSFRSDPARASIRIDTREVSIAPTADGFDLRVHDGGDVVGETPLPDVGETASAGGLEVRTQEVNGIARVVVDADGVSAMVAEREQHGSAD